MKDHKEICWLAALLAAVAGTTGCITQPIKRVGIVIGIHEDRIAQKQQFHADSNPGARNLLSKYHMINFSIYLQQIDAKYYEFGYYEYTGKTYDADMAQMGKEPRSIEWLKVCDPLQIPLPGAKGWTQMERVYFNQ